MKNIEALVSSDQFEEGQYKLLSYLLTRDELTYSDLSIITLSFFGDGLTSVGTPFLVVVSCYRWICLNLGFDSGRCFVG